MYKMYITASSKIGRKGVLSPMHFPRCVRSVFGGTTGPNSSNQGDKLYFYMGIKMRNLVNTAVKNLVSRKIFLI